MAAATELEALGEFAARHENDPYAHLEVAPLLHLSDRAAHTRLAIAWILVTRLPATLDRLRHGDLDDYKAHLIADALMHLSDKHIHQIEARVLPDAPEQTHTQLRHALQKAILAIDPEGAEERRQARKVERRVTSRPTEDGEAVLSIFHSVEKIAAIRAAITGRAWALKHAGAETRTLAQIEADVAADLLLATKNTTKWSCTSPSRWPAANPPKSTASARSPAKPPWNWPPKPPLGGGCAPTPPGSWWI
jgi:hypothetical protein